MYNCFSDKLVLDRNLGVCKGYWFLTQIAIKYNDTRCIRSRHLTTTALVPPSLLLLLLLLPLLLMVAVSCCINRVNQGTSLPLPRQVNIDQMSQGSTTTSPPPPPAYNSHMARMWCKLDFKTSFFLSEEHRIKCDTKARASSTPLVLALSPHGAFANVGFHQCSSKRQQSLNR